MKTPLYQKILTYFLLLVWVGFTILPVYWLLSASFKDPSEAMGYPPTLIPRSFTFGNFYHLLFESSFGLKPYLNSIIIALGATLLSTAASVLAGFGFSNFKFPFYRPLLVGILLLQMVPVMALVIPLFRVYSIYGLYDTRLGLILIYGMWTIPMNTWLLKGYFDTMPREMWESALIDGCSRISAFLRISFPIAAPGVAAAAIFAFSRAWNEFVLAVILTSRVRPYPVELYRFIGEHGEVSWSMLSSAAVVAIVPILIMFSFFQKYFIIGLAGGSVKG
ncbi:MAG: carbohydrate ABC transporter permease [Bacillota bacterium]|nr:carbohydrate ABC transporter permease [Bacillota bacterium]